ncbi:MAG: 30S ribosomal protein S4 [Candidatus Zambryskibacteria bacterium]|nr:30S ribosomal protein S4 [Candidatus Zambryskibacteria bacterium]
MRIGPKYKIARRLGAPVFEKTQTPKYVLSLARKEKNDKGHRKPKSEFGQELIEKQKTRYSYGLSEAQFRTYVAKALRASDPIQKLFSILESRLDNIVYRSGLAKTRAQARQAASHGHIIVNNARVTIPSILLSKGDVVGLRAGSASSPLFGEVEERMKTIAMPVWLKADPEKRQVTVLGQAVYAAKENIFDLGVVIEFYNR